MSAEIFTQNPGLARASQRGQKSFTGLTHVAATGVFTLSAGGFLDDLQAGDAVSLSSLTGGSAFTPGPATTYYLLGPEWAAGATTFSLSATYLGDPILGGTAVTVGTITTGRLTFAADGTQPPYISPRSARGR